jgi:hypothetical protein
MPANNEAETIERRVAGDVAVEAIEMLGSAEGNAD